MLVFLSLHATHTILEGLLPKKKQQPRVGFELATTSYLKIILKDNSSSILSNVLDMYIEKYQLNLLIFSFITASKILCC